MIRGQILIFAVLMSGAFCKSKMEPGQTRLPWDETRVRSAVEFLAAEPHPMGSARQGQIADWLQKECTPEYFPTQMPKLKNCDIRSHHTALPCDAEHMVPIGFSTLCHELAEWQTQTRSFHPFSTLCSTKWQIHCRRRCTRSQ